MGYLVLRHSMPSALSARWTPIGVGEAGWVEFKDSIGFFFGGGGGGV